MMLQVLASPELSSKQSSNCSLEVVVKGGSRISGAVNGEIGEHYQRYIEEQQNRQQMDAN